MSSTVSPIGETADERTRLRRSAGLFDSPAGFFIFAAMRCGVRSSIGFIPERASFWRGLARYPWHLSLQRLFSSQGERSFGSFKERTKNSLARRAAARSPRLRRAAIRVRSKTDPSRACGPRKTPFVCPAEHVYTRAIVRGIGIGMGLPSIERTLRREDRITEIEREIHVLPVAHIVLG